MYNFSEFLSRLTAGFTPVTGGYQMEDFTAIDLSEENPDLLKLEVASSEAFSVFIDEYLKNHNASGAYGGYDEVRTLYKRSDLFNNPEQNRNIHIGLDIWVPAGTPILSVLDAEVHSFRDNDNFGDYGPTIILKHNIENREFYTLYGHLARKSLDNLEPGQEFKAGEKIAQLGNFHENGDYAPHFHFQIIEDLQGREGDFPGVVKREDREEYLQNCPDPNLLLKIIRS